MNQRRTHRSTPIQQTNLCVAETRPNPAEPDPWTDPTRNVRASVRTGPRALGRAGLAAPVAGPCRRPPSRATSARTCRRPAARRRTDPSYSPGGADVHPEFTRGSSNVVPVALLSFRLSLADPGALRDHFWAVLVVTCRYRLPPAASIFNYTGRRTASTRVDVTAAQSTLTLSLGLGLAKTLLLTALKRT